MKTASLIAIVVAAMLSATAFAQPKGGDQGPPKVYRWVDENGEVHYSESLPPDIGEQKHDVLDRRGMEQATDQSLVPKPPPAPKQAKGELPRDASGQKRPAPLYSPQELQRNQDAFLLLRYDSEQEILDAMQVEINQLAYDRRLLSTSGDSLAKAYRDNVREAAERQRAGQPVEAALVQELQGLKRKLQSNAQSLAAIEERETSIRAMFDTQLERYRELAANPEAPQG